MTLGKAGDSGKREKSSAAVLCWPLAEHRLAVSPVFPLPCLMSIFLLLRLLHARFISPAFAVHISSTFSWLEHHFATSSCVVWTSLSLLFSFYFLATHFILHWSELNSCAVLSVLCFQHINKDNLNGTRLQTNPCSTPWVSPFKLMHFWSLFFLCSLKQH